MAVAFAADKQKINDVTLLAKFLENAK